MSKPYREPIQTVENDRYKVVAYLEADESCTDPFKDDDFIGKVKLFERGCYERNARIKEEYENDPFAIPLQMYSHGNVHYSVAGSRCYPDQRWDVAPLAGYWIADTESRDEYLKRCRSRKKDERGRRGKAAARAWLEERCNGIMDMYSNWCNGDCWGFVVEVYERKSCGEFHDDILEQDDCWGFIGTDYVKEQAQSSLNCMLEKYGFKEAAAV